MNWESVVAVSAMFGILWGIWAWVYDRRDRSHRLEVDGYQKKFDTLQSTLNGLMEKFNEFMMEVREEKVAVRAMKESFQDHILRLDKRADRHSAKIDDLGRMIRNE